MRAVASLGWAILRANLPARMRRGGPRPFKATVVLTERCDCRCEVCWIWKKPKGREPTPAEVAAFLRSAGTVRWLNLTGGEIFLRDDVVDVVRAAVDAEPRLAVLDFPTTGQRTDRIVAAVEEIARLKIPRFYVTVSLEGPPDLHDRLRGREGAFENMARTFAALRQIPGVHAYLGMTLSDRNAHALPEAVRAVRARVPGFTERDLHVNVATWSGHYYDNLAAGVGKPPDLRATLRPVLARRRARPSPTDRLEAIYLSLAPEHARTGRSPLPCRSLETSVFVAASGEVHPCTVYGRPLGNAWDTPLPQVLSTPEAADALRAVAEDRCPGCWSPCEAYQTILSNLPRALLRAGV
jgi:MoaA/NifB/PqqE/SkfB family radical SAM enzyme